MGRTKGSGAGSVYKRGDKWRGQIVVNGVRLSHTAEKKKDVLDWMAKVRTADEQPNITEYTVKEWTELYFEKYYKPRVTMNTYSTTTNLVETHLYPVLGDYLLKDLTTNIIQDAYPKMFNEKGTKAGGKYSDGTIKIFSAAFNKSLEYAQREGLIQRNPHANVVVQKTGITKEVDAYTDAEYDKIVEYTKDKTNIDRVFYMLIATGMRVGECIALTWNDVNLDEGWIMINKTAINYNGHMIVQDRPKTEQSVRKIYISKNTVKFLRRLKESNIRKEGLLVFANTYGNLYHTSALRSRWIKVCAKLEIPYKNLHALRHSWATRALRRGVEVHTVSKMLGHKSIATTMDVYKTVFVEDKKKAAEIMNDIL